MARPRWLFPRAAAEVGSPAAPYYGRASMLRLSRLRPLALGALVALVTPAAACSSKVAPDDAGAAALPESLAPVPAPDGLVAELYLSTPAATWDKLRAMVGGPAMFLPQSFGALV